MVTEEQVRTALREVHDPEFGINIVDLNLVRSIQVEGDVVHIELVMTTLACPLSGLISFWAEHVVKELPGVEEVDVTVSDEPWQPPYDLLGLSPPEDSPTRQPPRLPDI